MPDSITVSAEPDVITLAGDGWTDYVAAEGLTTGPSVRFESDAPLAAWTGHEGKVVADGRTGGSYQRSSLQ
jgi:hypothetical protein